jgi:hypothetical protein
MVPGFRPLYPFTIPKVGKITMPSGFRWCLFDKSSHDVCLLIDEIFMMIVCIFYCNIFRRRLVYIFVTVLCYKRYFF